MVSSGTRPLGVVTAASCGIGLELGRQFATSLMAGEERVVSHSATTKARGRGSRFLPDCAEA